MKALNVPGMSWLKHDQCDDSRRHRVDEHHREREHGDAVATAVTLGVFPLWWRSQRRRMAELQRENEALSKALRTPRSS